MTTSPIIEISLNKTKIIKGLVASLVFVAISAWILLRKHHTGNPVVDSLFIKYGVSIGGIIFFGFTAIFLLTKMSDTKPALIINDDGIFDNSSATAVGLISWYDINRFSILNVAKNQFLVVGVKNPELYIAAQMNPLKKLSLSFNQKRYGSPLIISNNILDGDLDELIDLLNERLKARTGIAL